MSQRAQNVAALRDMRSRRWESMILRSSSSLTAPMEAGSARHMEVINAIIPSFVVADFIPRSSLSTIAGGAPKSTAAARNLHGVFISAAQSPRTGYVRAGRWPTLANASQCTIKEEERTRAADTLIFGVRIQYDEEQSR